MPYSSFTTRDLKKGFGIEEIDLLQNKIGI